MDVLDRKARWTPTQRFTQGFGFPLPRVAACALGIALVGSPLQSPASLMEATPTHADDLITTEHADTFAQKDPFQGFNRVMFEFNMAVDKVFLQQAALAYRTILPKFAQNRVHDFVSNLGGPLSTLNYALQGEGDKFVDSLARFLFNTIFGLGGLFDVASEINLKVDDTTYDKTLGRWGADSGPYIMLPLLGPTTARGVVGKAATFFTDPFNMWAKRHDHADYTWYRDGASAVDKRARDYQDWNQLQDDSLDLYVSVRSMYFQNTQAELSSKGDLDDTDDELDIIDTPLPEDA